MNWRDLWLGWDESSRRRFISGYVIGYKDSFHGGSDTGFDTFVSDHATGRRFQSKLEDLDCHGASLIEGRVPSIENEAPIMGITLKIGMTLRMLPKLMIQPKGESPEEFHKQLN